MKDKNIIFPVRICWGPPSILFKTIYQFINALVTYFGDVQTPSCIGLTMKRSVLQWDGTFYQFN
jgi:hypothetical protein